MSALHRKITKSIEGRTGSSDDEEDEVIRRRWQAALRDIAAGTFKQPVIRVPVILNPNGPISSAEELQQLAELESVPETVESIIVRENGVKTERLVKISYVSLEEHKRLEERANVIRDTECYIRVMFEGKERYATVIQSLKEGVSLRRDTSN
ncbi:uncharacterized protein P884DRAFT_264331 [Thermothelomyces heterothallicus CBS 202.75]|uniref:uncharacterized protein n=1 Tax=Thermothelomyces heterothallicus CBS 202.75 TaxID=1149848 RepID=UPI003741F23E